MLYVHCTGQRLYISLIHVYERHSEQSNATLLSHLQFLISKFDAISQRFSYSKLNDYFSHQQLLDQFFTTHIFHRFNALQHTQTNLPLTQLLHLKDGTLAAHYWHSFRQIQYHVNICKLHTSLENSTRYHVKVLYNLLINFLSF